VRPTPVLPARVGIKPATASNPMNLDIISASQSLVAEAWKQPDKWEANLSSADVDRSSILHRWLLGPIREAECLRGFGPNSVSSKLNIGPAGAR